MTSTAAAASGADARFDNSAWSTADRKGKRKAQEEEDTEELGSDSEGEYSDDDDDDEEDELASALGSEEEQDQAAGSSKVLPPLSKSELESFARKQKKKGVIYISRIPPGMSVPKVKHVLESFGRVERIFLNDATQSSTSKTSNKKRHTSAHFTEGWAEFSSKSVAKAVAEMLNAQPIGAAAVTKSGMKAAKHQPGGMKGNARRFKDDVWTMKYLPGFKWHMLTEQLANERASRTSRLRTELTQSAFEQKDYLRKVERARIMNEKQAKRERRLASEAASGTAAPSKADEEAETRDGKRIRTFQQRAPVLKDVRDIAKEQQQQRPSKKQRSAAGDGAGAGKGKDKSAALDSVLASIF